MAQSIRFDGEQKVWHAFDYPFQKVVERSTIGELFLAHVRAADPHKVLEHHYDSGVERTVAAIYRDSVAVAVNLQKLGLRSGDVLVVYADTSPPISALTMGSLLLGVAVSFFETQFDFEQAAYVLALVSPTAILYEERYADAINKHVAQLSLPHLKFTLSVDGAHASSVDQCLLKGVTEAEFDGFRPPALGDPQKLTAILALTSGSTGLSKAIAISHAQLLHGLLTFWDEPERKAQITPDAVVFSFSPLRWISQICFLLEGLLLGAKRICVSKTPSGAYGREVIRHTRITHLFSTPTLYHNILLATDDGDPALSSLQHLLIGGEPAKQIILDLTARLAPNARPFRCYGMSEMAGCITNDPHINGGYLVRGLQLKILDDAMQPVGPNRRGQLCLRAPVPFLQYCNSANNATSYYADGFFNTGDYGYVDGDKRLHLIGRYKDLVRARGLTLVPLELETLIAALDEVQSAVLVGYRQTDDDPDDQGALFITLQKEVSAPPDAVKATVTDLLLKRLPPAEAAIVRAVHVVDAMPLSSCGKISRTDLKALARRLASGAGGPSGRP